MVLRALTGQGEASIPLVPNCRPDKYLRLIRELLSGHALGSPGGYPVYLSRWTRHGQMEGLHLGKLLLTGEPEAVAAVAYSPALTDELAGHVWWIAPTIENARLMLLEGVYLAPSAFEAGFVSAAHSDADIDATVAAAAKCFARLSG